MTIIDSDVVNEIYNVAGGFEQQNIDTVKKIIRYYYGSIDRVEQHLDFSYSRVGQDVRYALDDTKLRALGWEPKRIFDDEISSIVAHYRSNFIW